MKKAKTSVFIILKMFVQLLLLDFLTDVLNEKRVKLNTIISSRHELGNLKITTDFER